MARNKTAWMTDDIHDYILEHSTRPDPVQQRLIEETATLGRASGMQTAAEQGAFMTILTRLIGARDAVEVGTFTGYSALAVAKGLPDDGHLLCCDVSEEWTAVARRYWAEAGVDGKIELRIGPALDTLRSLPAAEQFDLAFVDADKENYSGYTSELIPRLRPGGVLLVDNVLWSGRVTDPAADDSSVQAIRAVNDELAADPRLELVVLPIADGLTLARKR